MNRASDSTGAYSEKVFEIAQKFEPVLCYDFYGSGTVQEIESLFGDKINSRHPILVSSGTMAFYACILALELDRGTEVLLPVNICQSIVNVLILSGLIPVFVEVDDDLCMDMNDLKRKITPNSGLVMFVHAYGYPMELGDIIIEYCHARGLKVIEDCAQAPGAMINDRPVGRDGDMAIYSFAQNKPISAGGGGMVCAGDEELAYRLRIVAREGTANYPDFIRLGLNMNVNDLHALLIYHWIEHFDSYLARKLERVGLYNEVFEGTIAHVGEECAGRPGCRHVFHKYVLKLPFGNRQEEHARFIDTLFHTHGGPAAGIAQPALPNPPCGVDYVNRYLVHIGRDDLAAADREMYTRWTNTQCGYLYLSTHHLLKESMIMETGRAILKVLRGML